MGDRICCAGRAVVEENQMCIKELLASGKDLQQKRLSILKRSMDVSVGNSRV
jgi:hypothetical protein